MNAEQLYYKLKNKKGNVRWKNEDRKEEYILFARSFEDDFSREDLTCIDLEQMEDTIG